MINRFFPVPVEEEPAPTPTPAVPQEVKEQETVTVYVAPAESFEFEAEIQENGLPRVSTASENYETIPFTVSVSELLGPPRKGCTWTARKPVPTWSSPSPPRRTGKSTASIPRKPSP